MVKPGCKLLFKEFIDEYKKEKMRRLIMVFTASSHPRLARRQALPPRFALREKRRRTDAFHGRRLAQVEDWCDAARGCYIKRGVDV
jgi:hypothetical protein